MSVADQYGPVEWSRRPAGVFVGRELVGRELGRRSVAALAAADVAPKPLTMIGVVTHDVSNRTLIVRRQEQASGREKLSWREAHNALVKAEQAGFPFNGAPSLWADGPGKSRIAHAVPGDSLTLRFAFPVPSQVYAELVSKAGLSSFVTVDRSSGWFVDCKFRHASGS